MDARAGGRRRSRGELKSSLDLRISEVGECGGQIEVEEDLLGEMVGLGFRREFVTRCVERNMHNLCPPPTLTPA
eukprot:3689541-Rhodomonas_salina.1